MRRGRHAWAPGVRGCPGLYPDVGVLVDFGQVQHVVKGQHSRRRLGEVQGWVDMVLEKPAEQLWTGVLACGTAWGSPSSPLSAAP